MFSGNNLIGVQTAQAVHNMNRSTPSYSWGNALAEALQGYQQGKQYADEQKAKQEQAAWEKERFRIEQDNAMQRFNTEQSNITKRHDDELVRAYIEAQRKNALDMYKAQQGDKTTDIKNYEYWLAQGLKPNEAQALATSGRTDAVGGVLANGGFGALGQAGAKEYDKAMGKALAEQEQVARQKKEMEPRLAQALNRSYSALNDGTGLGQIGGYGWTTDEGGKNRGDIETAQAQINTYMRGLLKELGVGATEMNSALEAASYRYQIRPDMPEGQIRRVLENFEQDYMNGVLMDEVSKVAHQYGGNSTSGSFNNNSLRKENVRIQAPDGKIYNVPSNEVRNAVKNGGKII